MNPKAALLFSSLGIVAAVAVIALIVWLISRQSGVRRKDYKRTQAQLRLTQQALADIDEVAGRYLNIDEVVAPQVNKIIRDHGTKQRELNS